MKIFKSFILGASMLCSGMALADYQCSSVNHDKELKVDMHYSNDSDIALVTLEDGNQAFEYLGKVSTEGGPFLKKKMVKFSEQAGSLSLSITPFGCSRAGCDIGSSLGKLISAELVLPDLKVYFGCHETNF